jgi:ABC-type transport system substrate-binding protein
VGTGPFKYKSWQQNTIIEFVRNDGYYLKDEAGRALPYVDASTFHSIIGDPGLAKSAFLTGRLDCACGFDHDYVTTSVDELKQKIPGVKIQLIMADQFNLYFNIEKAPFNNPKVRQAVSMLLDRRALVTLARGGQGKFPPSHMHSPEFGGQWGLPVAELNTFPGFREPFSREVDEAKRLLTEAGVSLDSAFTFSAILNPNVDPYHIAAANLLINAGLKGLKVDQKPSTAWSQGLAARSFDITMSAGGTSYDDPSDTFLEYVSTAGSRNLAKFNFGIDDLAAQQDTTLDAQRRVEIVRNIQRKLINDATYIPSVYQVNGYATQPYVEGYIPPALSVGPQFRLERLWLNR